MKKLLALALLPFAGCATYSPRSPLIYEDANIAIYEICERHIGDFVDDCRKKVVQKSRTETVNANVDLKTFKK